MHKRIWGIISIGERGGKKDKTRTMDQLLTCLTAAHLRVLIVQWLQKWRKTEVCMVSMLYLRQYTTSLTKKLLLIQLKHLHKLNCLLWTYFLSLHAVEWESQEIAAHEYDSSKQISKHILNIYCTKSCSEKKKKKKKRWKIMQLINVYLTFP